MQTFSMFSLKMYLSLICTWAVSPSKSLPKTPEALFLLEASKTPESPATDSSLTAAETDLVLVPEEDVLDRAAPWRISSWSSIGGGVSDMGESGGSPVLSYEYRLGLPKPEPWDMLLWASRRSVNGDRLGMATLGVV